MAYFNAYQIALVVVLVLNLVFWILVICFRLFFNFSCGGNSDSPQQRRRRVPRRPFQDSRNSSNRSLVGIANGIFVGDDGIEPFSINGSLEAPPSYEDAIKHSTIMISQRMLPPSYLNQQQEGSSQGRRPMVYEQSVLLMVPEESTSTSEARLTTSLSNTSGGARRASATQATISVDLPSANISNEGSSIMQECASLNTPNDSASVYDDEPITFVFSDRAAPRVCMTCSTRNVVEFEDGRELTTHTQA